MKIIISYIVGCIFCICALFFISYWWTFAPAIFLLTILFRFYKQKAAFSFGFFTVFISWFCLYLFYDLQNDSILSKKMATIFSLPNSLLLFFISSILIGLLGGLSALSASYLLRKK